MTAPLDAGLRRYAQQLLTGTGLDPAAAEAVATGEDRRTPPQAAAASAALRDGWATATHACQTPSETASGPDSGQARS
jgi:hypothetical protein